MKTKKPDISYYFWNMYHDGRFDRRWSDHSGSTDFTRPCYSH